MKLSTLSLGSLILVALCLRVLCSAQCNAPEVVKGAEKYNDLVCKGDASIKDGDQKKALGFFLATSEQTLLEFPNIQLYGRIAKIYARRGQFQEADLYLKYDNLSLLWLIGVVRCQALPSSEDEVLLQDGKLLQTNEATHMQNVLCGPIYDNNAYFGDRDATSFVPAAKLILRHDALRKEIDLMNAKQIANRRQNKGAIHE
jgi:hypothetical protein